MNSATLPSFWAAYDSLDEQIKRRAKRAYLLWADNPFHPSLHFKCINSQEDIWSARVSLSIRAVGVWFLGGQSGLSVWSERGNIAANKSLDGTATIKRFLEVSWHVIVDSFGGSHGCKPPLVSSALNERVESSAQLK